MLWCLWEGREGHLGNHVIHKAYEMIKEAVNVEDANGFCVEA